MSRKCIIFLESKWKIIIIDVNQFISRTQLYNIILYEKHQSKIFRNQVVILIVKKDGNKTSKPVNRTRIPVSNKSIKTDNEPGLKEVDVLVEHSFTVNK